MKIATVTGIRPDFIRMSAIFKRLDAIPDFQHVLIHTGQHYEEMLSDVFFKDFGIREPDYNLECGAKGLDHVAQLALLAPRLIKVLRQERPDWVLFLGDSNTVMAAPVVKKEGFHVAHIEAGMRSGDRRMLEETNRRVCDHCSDLLFTYHDNYARNLYREGHSPDSVHVVGNTIVEIVNRFLPELQKKPSSRSHILVDVHRPENFLYPARLKALTKFIQLLGQRYQLPIMWLNFGRTSKVIEELDLDIRPAELIPLQSYRNFVSLQYDALCMVSDSGTAQEEAPLLGTPVFVPRDYTERPESYRNGCSFYLPLDKEPVWKNLSGIPSMHYSPDLRWLGEGLTSELIVNSLRNVSSY